MNVPLSLVQPKDAQPKDAQSKDAQSKDTQSKDTQSPQITIIEAYGSYGISELADFSVRRASAMREGISYGVCHVRGGGELGEAWRLGGKDADKHHTWEDLIACGEFLIGRGTTAKDKLFILGGSAGGITVGRAITERPDLFAGAIDLVPAANTLRAEFTANGPPNVPEFGSISTQAGFENLYAMDTIAHIKKGTQYPAVHGDHGAQRSARFAVGACQACGGPAGVRVVESRTAADRSGSGTRHRLDQDPDRLRSTADWIAFAFWRSGVPEWQPRAH